MGILEMDFERILGVTFFISSSHSIMLCCIIVRRLLILVHKWQSSGMAATHEYWSQHDAHLVSCLLYTSPSPRDSGQSRMPSSA